MRFLNDHPKLRRFEVTVVENQGKPTIRGTLIDGSGDPLILTGSTVDLTYWRNGRAGTTTKSVTVTGGPTGEIEVRWVTNELDSFGEYSGRFEVTDGGSLVESSELVQFEVVKQ